MRSWSVALVAVALLALTPVATAQSVSVQDVEGRTQLARLGADASLFDIEASVTLAQAGDAYVKVLSAGDNPAYRNGTAGDTGWWTDVYLVDDSETLLGQTVGDQRVDLGHFDALETFRVRLVIHAPSAALATVTDYTLVYAIAASGDAAGSGNGATLHASSALKAELQVREHIESSGEVDWSALSTVPEGPEDPSLQIQDPGPTDLPGWIPSALVAMGLSQMVMLALLVYLVVDRARTRRRP